VDQPFSFVVKPFALRLLKGFRHKENEQQKHRTETEREKSYGGRETRSYEGPERPRNGRWESVQNPESAPEKDSQLCSMPSAESEVLKGTPCLPELYEEQLGVQVLCE
jgi:hypothetical protein